MEYQPTSIIMFYGNDEIILTTSAHRKQTIKEYFLEGGRNLEEYEEKETKTNIRIYTTIKYNID